MFLAGSHAFAAPPAPIEVTATDEPWDDGTNLVVRWKPGVGGDPVVSWQIFRSRTNEELEQAIRDARVRAATTAYEERLKAELAKELNPSEAARARAVSLALEASEAASKAFDANSVDRHIPITVLPSTANEFVVDRVETGKPYVIRVVPRDLDGNPGASTDTEPVIATMQSFVGSRAWLLAAIIGLSMTIIGCIVLARGGRRIKIRRIPGLDAIDEAVGRATEMGRPVLYIPGIQDMDNVQTVAGVTILGRVAKTAAEYDARIEVPTARSLVMTACRDAVQSAYFEAGRPESFNPDAIRYITDEQFGYVAYVAGRMVREKPATCIYMGQFYAESLLLAENGNAIGAIQIAGTAESSQLPFFVAACDYTLIGEEFFAASAYLSGEPTQLGSLLGQDVGKFVTVALILLGVALATIGSIRGGGFAQSAADFLANTVLKG